MAALQELILNCVREALRGPDGVAVMQALRGEMVESGVGVVDTAGDAVVGGPQLEVGTVGERPECDGVEAVEGVVVGEGCGDVSSEVAASGGSWADEELGAGEESEGSGSGGSAVVLPDCGFVKKAGAVSFGMFDEGVCETGTEVGCVAGGVAVEVPKAPRASMLGQGVAGGVAAYVRSARVRSFKTFVEQIIGCRVPNSGMYELSLASFSAGCVPAAYTRGRQQLRALELVGDTALANFGAVECYRLGVDVSEAQNLKSVRFSNANLSSACVTSGLSDHIAVPYGLNIGTAKTGANAVEVLVGVISMKCGANAVRKLVEGLKL